VTVAVAEGCPAVGLFQRVAGLLRECLDSDAWCTRFDSQLGSTCQWCNQANHDMVGFFL
jgi:hypothetical protein